MCIFSRNVGQVSGTRIFARPLDNDRQVLVYAMDVGVVEELAMVLPIPVVPGSGDHAVELINLEGYPTFFEDLDRVFVRPRPTGPMAPMSLSPTSARLVVHDVGAFSASYVPHPKDFERLDVRFRLPGPVLAAHADYADWGFVVFQLKPRPGIQTVHPMAFSFPSRRPRALYFPTLHVHDGASIPREAKFDHELYCQVTDPLFARTLAWEMSWRPVRRCVSGRRARGVVVPRTPAWRDRVANVQPNADTWIEPPACAGAHVLHGSGEHFSFELKAAFAYDTTTWSRDARADRWRDTARNRLDELHAGLMRELAELTRRHATAWKLGAEPKRGFWARVRGDRTPRLSVGISIPIDTKAEGRPLLLTDPAHPVEPGAPGPWAMELSATGARVELQTVRFVFATAPAPELIAEIERALVEVLDRAIT